MNLEALNFFRQHPVSHGLSDEECQSITRSLELVRSEPGEYLQRVNERVTFVYLIVRGRLRAVLLDDAGHTLLERDVLPGDQFGGMSAALNEPAAINLIAVDPSTLLKLDYQRGVELFREHPKFRANFVQLVAQSVKRAVMRERRPHRPMGVCFFHQSADTRPVTAQLFSRLADLGETLHVLSDQPVSPSTERIQFHRIFGGDQAYALDKLRNELHRWLQQGRVFGDFDTTVELVRAQQAFDAFGLIGWCVTAENWEASVRPLQAILARSPSWRDKIFIVWLLRGQETAPLARELRELTSRDVKISFEEPGPQRSRALVTGFERLVHLIRGVQIGVALGGGAARGMAHLGVLKALEQQGIIVDMIAGTSAGAMTGTLYASGMDVDYAIHRFVIDLRPSWFFRMIPRGDQWYLLYKYRTRQFDPMLRKYLHNNCLEQLPLTMHAITVDLIGGKAVVREQGDAVQGIVESINLPVLAKPINREGQSLVDGGLIDNVPADVLARKGCNLIIAVSVTAKMEPEFVRNRPDTPTHQMRPASTIQTLLRSYLVQSVSINSLGVEPADIVIEPDVTDFELTAFTRTDELAAIGEQATLAAIPQIREQLHRLDPQLFPATDS